MGNFFKSIKNKWESIKEGKKGKNTFPEGTKYEEELNSNFKYFNIYWYDPNRSNDFDHFTKCFENVEFCKGYDLDTTINFFKKESNSEWIVITPGSQGEELIQNLENFNCIKSFFIYCRNTEFHDWANKIKKVGCLTSNPEILCQKFIELNTNYIIPKFNYKRKENNDILSNLNKIDSKNILNLKTPFIKLLFENENKVKNKYNNLCIKLINYLNGDDVKNDLAEDDCPLNEVVKLFPRIEKELYIESIIDNTKNLTILSLYFSKYPYLFNLLSFQEVKDLFKEKIQPEIMIEQKKLSTIIEKLSNKITENECILDEKDELKEMQISLIHMISYNISLLNQDPTIYINYYQIINFFRDIDFCLKLYISNNMISAFNNKKHNFMEEMIFSLTLSEPRFNFYLLYVNQIYVKNKFNEETENEITNEETENKITNEETENKITNEETKNKITKNKMTDEEIENKIINSLTIKDFIIVGDPQFFEMIKAIENNIKSKSFKYLNIKQIYNYLEEKKKEKGPEIWTCYYFLIMRLEEYQENLEKIVILSFEFGVTFLIFLYIENEDNIKLYKNQINFIISTILVYSPQDIVLYLSQKLKFCSPLNNLDIEEIGEMQNIKIPKITFEQNDEEKYEDGCFELAETFDVNIIKNKYVFRILDHIDLLSEFSKNIYYIYKAHNAEDLFCSENCRYFGWRLYPELNPFSFCLAKTILYMYCREEKVKEQSFYRIINDDLRSRDPHKIYQYINVLALFNEMIENNFLESYKGKVYRATVLDENLILKLVPGNKMVNTTFWSTSKEFRVAENFMKKDNWRNSYIICKTLKNNIDIDLEKLSPFKEKEVLYLPFTEFRIEKVSSKIEYKKKIFTIEVTELGNRNFVNIENMKVENVNNFGVNYKLEKYFEKEGEELKEQIIKNFKFDEQFKFSDK